MTERMLDQMPQGAAGAPDEAQAPPPSAAALRRAERMRTPHLLREQATLLAMVRMHCAHHHGPQAPQDAEGLCPDCAALMAYARKRLAGCPFGADKPTCANCQIHCYGPGPREQVRQIMRWAGPRMLTRHPILAIRHLIDGRRAAPPKPRGAGAGSAKPQPPAPG